MIKCKGGVETVRVMQDGTVFSPILSHTLTVVVQLPKFGQSTTMNNKGQPRDSFG